MSQTIGEYFKQRFGRRITAQASAPGRVNLIGEHIDYNGGTVLPMALSCTCTVAIAPNESDTLNIASDRFDDIAIRPADDPANAHWSDHVVGAMQKATELGFIKGGFDIYVESTVPGGAGVSSSAALSTAVLRAAMAHNGHASISPTELAMAARAVENDYIGVPCGIMDQMAVGLLQPGEALALDTKTVTTETVTVPNEWTFIVLHSGTNRKLSDGRYEVRFTECADAAKALNVEHLCDAPLESITSLPEPLANRARHVITEHTRTRAAIKAMKAGDINTFGALMNESHASYSKDFEASTSIIDTLVDTARQEGAIGARLTGGGFGGCSVCLLPAKEAKDWQARILDTHSTAWVVG